MNKPMDAFAALDDIATRLPQIEFKEQKKKAEYYNQKMQSLRGGRQFYLRTSPTIDSKGTIRLALYEYGTRADQNILLGTRSAIFSDTQSIHRAVKSLERKAGCKLYYVLLISTDGEYL